jgi:hypothetical protein
MSRNKLLHAVNITLAVILFLPTMSLAENTRGCTKQSVAGSWAFTTTGTIVGIGPAGAIGTYVADGSGNLSGSQTRSLNGDVADETFTGTYSVDSNCRGTDVIQVYESGVLVRTTILRTSYDDNGEHARAIFQSLMLPDGSTLPTVLTIDAERISSNK